MNIDEIVTLKTLPIPRAHVMDCCDLEVVVVTAKSTSKGLMIST